MTTEISQARYTALIEFVQEKYALGLVPPAEWLDQITTAQTLHPEWIIPPPPPVNGYVNGNGNTNGLQAYATNGASFVPPPPMPPPPPPSAPPPPPSGPPPSAAVPPNKGERLQIAVDENMERIAQEVLLWWGSRFTIFQAGGKLLEVQTDVGKDIEFLAREPDSPRMVEIKSARARALASRECTFVKEKTSKDGEKENTEILPPDWLGPSIVTRTDFPGVPVFAALAQAPTLRRDGALIREQGYDRSTGIYLTNSLEIKMEENPTQEAARFSAQKLLDLLCDFDFINPAGKSVWLAGLLSVACRHTFAGPAPIFIIDASKRGSGKTMLADMISNICLGRSAPRMIYTSDDNEMDKRMVALGTASPQIVLIDNIVGKLSSPALDAVLTCDTYSGRVLAKSEMTSSMPMKMVWFATGNGMIIGADTARRALLARLEPPVDHPEHRNGPRPGVRWRYKLPDHCNMYRAELLTYALTIVSAYIRAGRPEVTLGDGSASFEMGSYKKWSDTIRSAIVWAGVLDPCETIKDAQAADLDDLALRNMVECWPAGDNVILTTSALIKQAEIGFGEPAGPSREMWRNALLEWLPAKPGSQLPTPRDLGYALRSIKGSIIGNFKIEADKHTTSGIPWKRVRVSGKSEENPEKKNIPGLVSV